MKEYLLLRNNVQSGPYSLNEVGELGLKPFDLIWVENKSFSWRYAAEINELSAFAPPIEPTLDRAMERMTTATTVQANKNNLVVTRVREEAVQPEAEVLIATEEPFSPPVTRAAKHVVALKPHIDHVDIKTIKLNQSPKVVKVQVRSERTEVVVPTTPLPENKHYGVGEPIEDETDNSLHSSAYRISNPVAEKVSVYDPLTHKQQQVQAAASPVPNVQQQNRLEIAVLLVGALSLLAVAYLLLTSSY